MIYKELDIWKSSMLLAELVYKQTKDFPRHGQFGLAPQITGAVVPVPANNTKCYAGKGIKGPVLNI
ncbi:MAG: four helix bundle protein [Chlorobi bacterium]|nr:four helix bundle protein [Chlorobiota bacterium]